MHIRLLTVVLAAFVPVLACAQPAKPAQPPQPAQQAQPAKPAQPAKAAQSAAGEDEDVKFEESIRNFGFVSGAAYQCLPEAERTAHDREVLRAYSGIVRLFGSDRAFFYAAAFGAGTSMPIDKAECAGYIADFRAAMKSSTRGGQ
jgi:hypothetical protein